jgi:hypothetical protein
MSTNTSIRVVHRNLRWEVSVNGTTRPREDWFFSQGRAVTHALERASELGADMIRIESWDGTVESWVDARGNRITPLPLAG